VQDFRNDLCTICGSGEGGADSGEGETIRGSGMPRLGLVAGSWGRTLGVEECDT
jgi:hypothetical protein